MTTVAIVYFTGTGHTGLMAEAVEKGVQSVPDTTAEMYEITGTQFSEGRWQDDSMLTAISAADAIVFGSPTYMGGVAAQLKAFIDGAGGIWFSQGWKNKIAGGFTHSGSPSGDKQSVLMYLSVFAAQHSMLWIGCGEMSDRETGVNRLGSYMGAMGNGDPNNDKEKPAIVPGDAKTAELYGQRIAKATHAWTPDGL